MTESRNRDLATSIGAAVASDNIATDGSLAISGVITYTNLSDLPSSGVSAGDLGFVTANNGLYIRGTSGWYVIALVNTSPSYTTSPASSYDLATDGSTTTVITIVATDPEGFAITYSAIADSDFNGLATVSQSSNVFTVTPKSQANATTTSGTLTFRASDSVNNTDVISTFTLIFVTQEANSQNTTILLKASGNNKQNTFVDSSTTGDTVSTTGSPLGVSYSPFHPIGYSKYFDGGDQNIELQDDANTNPGDKNFTIEAWVMLTEYSTATYPTIMSRADSTSARQFALYIDQDKVGFKIWNSTNTEKSCEYAVTDENLFKLHVWYHIAAELSGSVSDRTMNLYVDGRRVATTTGSIDSSYVRDSNNYYLSIGDGYWTSSRSFIGYMRDVRLSFNSTSSGQTPRYSGADFNVPTEPLEKDSTTQLLVLNGEGWPYDKSDNNCDVYTRLVYNSSTTDKAFFQIISPYDHNGDYSPSTHGTAWHHLLGTNTLSIAHNASTQAIGTNAFCVEAWVYPTKFSSNYDVIASKWSAGAGFTLGYTRNGPFGYLRFSDGASADYSHTAEPIYAGQWSHIAAALEKGSGNSSTLKTYVNGKLAGTTTTSATTVNDVTGLFTIGSYDTSTANYGTVGLMSDFRMTVGSAVYTSTFTPLTSPLSVGSNTKILVNSDLGIYDAAGGGGIGYRRAYNMIYGGTGVDGSLKIEGNAKSSTTQTKFATSSMYFDGTGDLISLANVGRNSAANRALGDRSFAISFWMRPDNITSGERVLCHQGDRAANGWGVLQDGATIKLYNHTGFATSSNVLSANTWHHIMIHKETSPIEGDFGNLHDSCAFFVYVDGVVVATRTSNNSNGALNSNVNARLQVGGNTSDQWGTATGFVGYIEDFKLVDLNSGYSNESDNRDKRQAPFIISRETSTADSNTFLLCCHASAWNTVSGNWTVTNGGTAPTVSQFSPVKNGYSLFFDGATNANNRILLSHTGSSSDYNIGDIDNGANANWSLDGWFWTDQDAVDQYIISTYPANTAAGNTFMLGTRKDSISNAIQLRRHSTGTGDRPGRKLWNQYRWQHFLFTQEYDSSASNTKVSLYINGKHAVQGTESNTNAYDFGDIAIGGQTGTGTPWRGYLSNVRIQTGTVIHPGVSLNTFSVPTTEVKG